MEDWTADLTALTLQLQQSLGQISQLEEDNRMLTLKIQKLEKEGGQTQLVDQFCKVSAQLNQMNQEKSQLLAKIDALQTKFTQLQQSIYNSKYYSLPSTALTLSR